MITPPLSNLTEKSIIYRVTNLSPEVCQRVREARRAAGLSQSALAAEVGCKQSALSMFEQGDGTKLSGETIGKLLKKFGIEASLSKYRVTPVQPPRRSARGYCPNPLCPSHQAYNVEGRTFLRPDRAVQDPVGGKFCAVCGEILELKCPACGAEVHDGAVCSFCGNPYVATS